MSTVTTPAPATLDEAARAFAKALGAKWAAEAEARAAAESERQSLLPRVDPNEDLTPPERLNRARVFLAEALLQEGNNNGNVILLIELAQDEVNALAEALADPSQATAQGAPS